MTRHKPASASDTAAEPALEKVGQRVTELISAMKALDDLGIQKCDVPIPKVIVVGDQSAGKSSLIQAMTGISVPRAASTCTRVRDSLTLRL